MGKATNKRSVRRTQKHRSTYSIQQRNENTWCCMEELSDGSLQEHICFETEHQAKAHLKNAHGPSMRGTKQPRVKHVNEKLNVAPDPLDFRDKMYQASLHEVPLSIPLQEYKTYKVPILNQGSEGACTGYALATVANYLLRRRRQKPDKDEVSARMLYVMARRYDEWEGSNYSGSSARGAMKGWHKHGLCAEKCFPNNTRNYRFNEERTSDALKRPLGAYYRVNHKDLVAMHSALAEVGILYATSAVHSGWDEVNKDGRIPLRGDAIWGHAFAIVAYDEKGFWIQNSWGKDWGKEGFGQISYDDWLQNATDVWVARLGAPVFLEKARSTAVAHADISRKSNAYSFSDLRPHIVSLGNNGVLEEGGEYGTSVAEVETIFESDFPRVTKGWKKKRLLLYAHGGLVPEKTAIQRLADYREPLLKSEIYPVSLIWHTDAWTTITNILQDAVKRKRPEGAIDKAKDFLLDRLDDALEPLARAFTGKLQWNEMKENALLATRSKTGGLRFVLDLIKGIVKADLKKEFEIHLIAHSAGSILLAPLVKELAAAKIPIEHTTLWAPAITIELFKECYLPSVNKQHIKRLSVFNLTDAAERDDHCAHIYNKSLLYLVSNAFEDKVPIPLIRPKGTPLLGLTKYIKDDKDLTAMFKLPHADLILSPNAETWESNMRSTCTTHGGFDDDEATVNTTLSRMLNASSTMDFNFKFNRSAASLRDRRQLIDRNSD
jgi:hypothetical protein